MGSASAGRWLGPLVATALGAAFSVISPPARAEATTWVVDAPRSDLVVTAYAAGLFTPFLKDHYLAPTEWSGRVVFDPERPSTIELDVLIDARSLVNRQTDLSEEDRRKVDAQIAGPDVLDASAYPTIRYRATRLEVSEVRREGSVTHLDGALFGTLHLRGQLRPVLVPVAVVFTDDVLRVNLSARILQSEFGIEPYRTGLGTIGVDDRVDVQARIEARPAP